MQERRVAARDLAILRRGDDHAEQVDATEVVGRLIAWLLDPPVRQQVNALSVGELVVNVGPDSLTGHTNTRVKVIIVKPLH